MSRSKRAALAGVLLAVMLVVLFAWAGLAQAHVVERVSVKVPAIQGDGWSEAVSLSADGRYGAFYSNASNLVTGDTNGVVDVFVQDRNTGAITRVSVDSAGVQADGESRHAAISADGRYVAFYSDATNLVPDDTNGVVDIFVHDRHDGTTARVSVDSAGAQGERRQLLPLDQRRRPLRGLLLRRDQPGGRRHQRRHGRLRARPDGRHHRAGERGQRGDPGQRRQPDLPRSAPTAATWPSSPTPTNLVAGDTNGVADVFVRDRTDRHHHAGERGQRGDPRQRRQPGSLDQRRRPLRGLRVRRPTTWCPGTPTVTRDVFVRDRNAGTTERVSVDSAGNAGRPGPARFALDQRRRPLRGLRLLRDQPGVWRHQRA